MTTTNCKHCGPLPVSEFYRHATKGYQNLCKVCKATYNREHYVRNKQAYKERAKKSNIKAKAEVRQFVYKYLSMHPCVKCSEDDPVALDFHHTDPETKCFRISRGAAAHSLQAVKLEIEKCIVMCANCHRKETARQLGWYKDFRVSG